MPPAILATCEHPTGARATARLKRLARGFLAILRLSEVELSLVVTTDRKIRALNKRWRDKDQATDVLSFPADPPIAPVDLRALGDIVISLDTARARAREEGRKLDEELALYLAHGLLHLLGHDHHEPREARRMARAESALLGTVGMVGRTL